MASYFSSILTSTTSRVATLSSKFLASENDGDTEDDTHLCRVLRAYYTEKGRAFPGWLPPDPKAPAPKVVEPVYASNVGARYGGDMSVPGGRGGNKMASLWDRSGAAQEQQQQQQSDLGLRAGRGGQASGGRTGAGGAARQNPFTRSQTPQAQPVVESRPLPSQRAGSYQSSMGGGVRDQTPPGSSGGMSARDRMKQRFRQGAAAGGQIGSMAEDSSRADSYGSQSSAASSGGGGGERPYISANSPWASSEPDYGAGAGGGYDSASGSNTRRAQGLRGPGLPNGPRGMR